MTHAKWAKAAKFCGFKTVAEYKRWYRKLMSQRKAA